MHVRFSVWWIAVHDCRYVNAGYVWPENASNICMYCATYHDSDCATLNFALGWIVFFVIYLVNTILIITCGYVSCRQMFAISYIEQLKFNVNNDTDNDHVISSELPLLINAVTNAEPDQGWKWSRGTTISEQRHKLRQFLDKYNIDLATFMAIINALISIVGTSIVLISETAGHGSCIKYKERQNKPKKNEGLKGECTISIVTIAIGVFILIVIAIRYCIPKCKCFIKQQAKSTHGLLFHFMWALIDEHLRGTITVKFLYFCLKPLLVSVTESTGKDSTLIETFNLLYLVLMFCSATALAYITFNKRYKVLLRLGNIMNNPKMFGKTYMASYLLSIITSYSILIIVCVYAWTKNMKKSNWSIIIYPQCIWLLLIQIVESNNDYNVQSKNINDSNCKQPLQIVENINADYNIVNNNYTFIVVEHSNRLFLYQLSSWLASIYACAFYLYCIISDLHAAERERGDGNHYSGSGWIFMYYWQFIISLCVVCILPLAMVSSLHKKIKRRAEQVNTVAD